MKYNYWLIFGRTRREGIENTELIDRLWCWIKLYKSWIINKIICSWWISHKIENQEQISEARKMSHYLISMWVDTGDIIIEDESKETIWNLLFSIEKVGAEHIEELYLISNDHHIWRIVQYCWFIGDIDFGSTTVWVRSKVKNEHKMGASRDLVESRAHEYANKVFAWCNSLESFKVRLLSHYFSYNPNSLLTKEIVQAYHRWDIEIEVVEKTLEKMKI